MLVHIVIWKYKDETIEAERVEHRKKLAALKTVIPELKSLHVGSDILSLDRSYDTGLVATFEGQAGLDAYTNHPLHQEVAKMGKQIAAHAASVDFFSEE